MNEQTPTLRPAPTSRREHHLRWLLPLAALFVLALAWLGPVDRLAEEQSDAGLKRALATFAAARVLNGVISVAQGTEVAVEPAGIGVTFAPGQVLDPINDLVEQFSTLMLTASVSFGVQKALVFIGGHWAVSAVLSVLVLAWVGWRLFSRRRPSIWLGRVALLLILVRFAVPMVALGSDAAYRLFLADRYAKSQAALTLSTTEVGALGNTPSTPPPDETVGARMHRWWSETGENFDVSERLDALKEAAARATEHIVELIVIFLLQTLIVPTALLWALWRAGVALVSPRA
jgi:hypothetical protein